MYWLDTTILAVLGLGIVLGLRSGFLWQVSRIAGLSLAGYGTMLFHQLATKLCQDFVVRDADPNLSEALAYGGVFLGIYLTCFFVTRGLQRFIKATDLELIDRLLGGALGAVKMTLLVMVVCIAASYADHPPTNEAMSRSAFVPGLTKGFQGVIKVVPESYRSRFTDALSQVRAKVFPQEAKKEPDDRKEDPANSQ